MLSISRISQIAALITLIVLPVVGLTSAEVESAEVRSAHERWFSGLIGDRAVLSEVLAADVTLRFPGGNQVPRNEFLRLLESGELAYDSATHSETEFRVYGNTGVVTGRSTLAHRFQGNASSERLAYTAVYIRTSEHWKMVAWQSTIDQL